VVKVSRLVVTRVRRCLVAAGDSAFGVEAYTWSRVD
jgi:hypothetical protein